MFDGSNADFSIPIISKSMPGLNRSRRRDVFSPVENTQPIGHKPRLQDMPTQIRDYPEHFHRILNRYASLMSQLEIEYGKSNPAHGESGFREHVFEEAKKFLAGISSLSALLDDPSTLEKLSDSIAQDQVRLESDVAFIHFACVYSAGAMSALEIQDRDLAWDLLCQANFYLGVVMFTNRGQEIFTEAVVGTYKFAKAAEGGTKRHKKTNDMKARAYEFMRSQAPWPSQSNAATAIESALRKEYGEEFNLKDPETTITNWIKSMPDRLELIPALRERLKQT